MLGFVIAFLGLDYNRVQLAPVPQWLVPLVLGEVPLLDLVFAIMRRVRKKCSFQEIAGTSTTYCCSAVGRQGRWRRPPSPRRVL
jgi:hypothetical protein